MHGIFRQWVTGYHWFQISLCTAFGALAIAAIDHLGLCGLSHGSYPSSGYIILHLEFPTDVVGVKKEMITTAALICLDPKWMKGAPIIVGTNLNLFQLLAQFCQRQAGKQYMMTWPFMGCVPGHTKLLRTS